MYERAIIPLSLQDSGFNAGFWLFYIFSLFRESATDNFSLRRFLLHHYPLLVETRQRREKGRARDPTWDGAVFDEKLKKVACSRCTGLLELDHTKPVLLLPDIVSAIGS